MSHVTTIDIEITDLDALRHAAEQLGLEMAEASTYRRHAMITGELPQGFTRETISQCEYVLRIPAGQLNAERAYEVGVTRNPQGNGYTLLYDHFCGGMGLMEKVSTDRVTLNLLKQEYGAEVTRKTLVRQGYRVRQVRENGQIKLEAVAR